MFFRFVLIDDVENGVTFGFQVVSDQTAVTAPPNSFRTHHRRTLLRCDLEDFLNPGTKPCRLHVIGIRADRRILRGRVMRIGLRSSASTKPRLMPVFNPNLTQRLSQLRAIKLRVTPRTREAAHINQHLNLMRPEYLEKLPSRARRMP